MDAAFEMDTLNEIDKLARLTEGFCGDSAQLDAIAPACKIALSACRKETERLRDEIGRIGPKLNEWLRDKSEDLVSVFAEAPLVLYGNSAQGDVIGRWQGQLLECGNAVKGIISDDKKIVGEWLYRLQFDGAMQDAKPFFQFQQMRDCLKEIQKLAELLSNTRKVTTLKKAEILFRADFSRSMDLWNVYGGGEVGVADGQLNVKGLGVTVWCAREFGDALVSFDFKPISAGGNGAGALFAFPATPLPGKGYDASAGAMENYNLGIATYHVSLCRGNSGRTNIRRTGKGLKMLSTVQPDPCTVLGRTYRVEILKWGPTVQVHVDGRLIHAYVDAGCYGPILKRGRFGLRHFSGADLESCYGNFEVHELVANT